METFYHLKNLEQILMLVCQVLGLNREIFSFIKNAELKQKEYPHFPECIRTIIASAASSNDNACVE